MWLRLSREFGIPISKLVDQISALEFAWYKADWNETRFGMKDLDLMLAQNTAVTARCGGADVDAYDFTLFTQRPEQRRQTDKEIEGIFNMIANASKAKSK